MKDLSIIVTCFMHEQYVSRAYWSARNQKTDLDFEVFIVHDNCEQGIPKGTIGALRNRGIKHAKGKWIICLDADDVLPTNYVESLFSASKRQGYLMGECFVGCPSQFMTGRALDRLNNMEERSYEAASLFTEPLALPASTLFSNAMWRKMGGFDESMPVCEDLDFWCKLLSHGYSYVHTNRTCLLKNNEGPTLSHRTSDKWKEMIELVNKRYAMAMPAPEII